MLDKFLPLTKIRLDILSELYQNELNLIELNKKFPNKSKQTIHTTLKNMNMLNKKNNVYSIKPEFNKYFEKVIKYNLLKRRMGKYFDSITFIKRYLEPEKMYLFGSCARGEMHEKSDIDIYIISNKTNIEVSEVEFRISNLMKINFQLIAVKPNILETDKNKFSDIYKKIKNNIKEGIEIDLDLFKL